jgi:hypothetical protein
MWRTASARQAAIVLSFPLIRNRKNLFNFVTHTLFRGTELLIRQEI